MNRLKMYPESSRKQREFTAEEDFLILERILPRLKFKKLSTSGFLLTSDLLEQAGEFHRNHGSVRERWEGTLQPWLLQNLTGTSGLRVELMLANLVKEKLGKDKVVAARKEINWEELVKQHKEFAGHTNRSLRRVYDGVINRAEKKYKLSRESLSLQLVADYVMDFGNFGNSRREKLKRTERRETVLSHFNARVKELKIKVIC